MRYLVFPGMLLATVGGMMTANAQQMFHDTLFLERRIVREDTYDRDPHSNINYSGRYIEQNKSSGHNKRLLDFNFKKITVLGNYDPAGKIDRGALAEIPREWYPVFNYHGRLFMFSDRWFNRDLLTDTAFLDSGMEGVYSNGLTSFEKIDAHTFQLTAHTWHDKIIHLRIHLIDTVHGLAVFEYFTPCEEKRDYSLMVGGADKIKSFPLMVSFSQTKYLPDTTWYAERPGDFYLPPMNAKLFLNKDYAAKMLQKML